MKHWVKTHVFGLSMLALIVVSFSYFVFMTNSATFADPDSFYHVKMAERMIEGKDVRQFPWLPFTVLNSYFTDQHFLYHAVLIPFIAVFGAFTGAKLATTVLATGLIVMFVYLLRQLRVRYAPLYGFLLLTVLPSIFRINLTKAPAFSLLILFAGLLFALKRKWFGVFLLSFIYVWSYGGFILLPIFVLLLCVMRLFARWWTESAWLKSKKMFVSVSWWEFFVRFIKRKDVHVAVAVVIGTIVGIVTNPYFPNNLKYLNDQLIQIGLVNYQHIIGVGGEWYPYGFGPLLANTIMLTVLVVLAVVWGAISIKKIKLTTWFAFLLYLFFLAFTLKSRRYVEYYGPFGMFFVATCVSDCLRGINVREALKKIKKTIWSKYFVLSVALAVYVVVAFAVVISRDIVSNRRDLHGGFSYTADKSASQWLAANTPKNAIIVHSDWDEFPYLFYWNDHNRYIAGLDPTFLYKADANVYWAWVNLTTGKTSDPIEMTKVVTQTLQSQYVLIETGHNAMLQNFRNNMDFSLVYQDDEASIFSYVTAPTP